MNDGKSPAYSAEEIRRVRQAMVRFRDSALDQHSMDAAIILTHTIQILWEYSERIHGVILETDSAPCAPKQPDLSDLTNREWGETNIGER